MSSVMLRLSHLAFRHAPRVFLDAPRYGVQRPGLAMDNCRGRVP